VTEEKDDKQWVTMAEACRISGLSQRTIQRRIKEGTITSKKQGRNRLILTGTLDTPARNGAEMAGMDLMGQIREENQFLREQVRDLTERLKDKDREAEEDRKRQQTIILQMTRQLESQQRLIEYKKTPWWKRILTGKKDHEG
jgi:excisionase family DNA binding protein